LPEAGEIAAFCDRLVGRILAHSRASEVRAHCMAIIAVEIELVCPRQDQVLLIEARDLLRNRLERLTEERVHGVPLFDGVTI
jgi:hypothetical protein